MILKEGLEVLGTEKHSDNNNDCCGVFEDSAIAEISLPSTLKRIGYSTFKDCKNLKCVRFPDSLEVIESCAFS